MCVVLSGNVAKHLVHAASPYVYFPHSHSYGWMYGVVVVVESRGCSSPGNRNVKKLESNQKRGKGEVEDRE